MAKKAPAKRAPRKPSAKPAIDISSLSAEDLQRLLDAMKPPKTPRWWQKIDWRPWLVGGAKAAVMVAIGVAGGVWVAGGVPIGPGPMPSDVVSTVFDTQETAFRRLSGERAKALRDGDLASEKASADWMAAKYLPESDAAWAKLLTAEAAAFGGEQWTAEKEAAHIERYAR